MKQGSPLTESIGTNTGTPEERGEPTGSSLGRSSTHDVVPESAHTVSVRIATTGGYTDHETFSFGGEKAANAFARGVMKASVRAFERRDDAE